MFAKRLWLVALLALVMLQVAAAQDNQVSGLIGRTFISDQGIPGATFPNPIIHFGNGLTFEGNYSRRVLGQGFSRLWLEVPTEFNYDEDLATGANVIPKEYKSLFVAPSARVNFFSMTAISPWVSFGGGIGYFNVSKDLLYGGNNPSKGSSVTGAIQFGGGLDVRIRPSWGVRAAVRDFWTGVPNLNVNGDRCRQHNYFVGGGVIYHFGK